MLKKKFSPYFIALLVIIALNALLKWRFFCGLVQADDFSYGVYSYTMFRDIWPWNEDMDFRMLRMGLMFPVSLVFRILPPAEFTAVLFPMAASFGTVALVYLIGRKLYGPNAGIIGAFVVATFPGDVIFGTMILPDIVVPFYLGMAVWLFLKAESGKGLTAKLLYALTGFFVFSAFSTRENSYYFLLFFLPFAFSRVRWKRGFYLIGIGFVLPVVFLYGIYYLKTGDFLFNVHLATKARDAQIASGYIPGNTENMFTQFKYMFPVVRGQYGQFLSGMYGLTFYLGVPCLVYTAVKAVKEKNRAGLMIPWWFLFVYFFLEFGTLSFSHYQVMKKLPRFLLTLTPAMALGYGVVLNDALGLGVRNIKRVRDLRIRRAAGSIGLVILTVVLYTSYGVAASQKTSRDSNMQQFRWGYYDVLKNRPGKPVYGTGGWWNNKLSFYLMPDVRYADMNGRRSDMLRDLKAVEGADELSGSYVIIDRKHFSGQNDLRIRHSYDDFGLYVILPPREWKLLGMAYGVEIYEVPENWKYSRPDEKVLIKQILKQALVANDPMRFLYCLHPDVIEKLDRNSFFKLFNKLVSITKNGPSAIMTEKITFERFDGKFKAKFDLE